MSINIHREMSFWSLVIKPGEKYTFTVERPFHISKAVIDFSSRPHDSCGVYIHSAITSLVVDCDDQKGIILCNLVGCDSDYGYSKKAEADLDVYFRAGQHITFHSEQPHPDGVAHSLNKPFLPRIHLSGYEFVV